MTTNKTNALDELRKKFESVKTKNESSGANNDLFLMIKEIPGEAELRILPGVQSEHEFYMEVRNHKIQKDKAVQCAKLDGDECPICKVYYDIWQEINRVGKDSDIGKNARQFLKSHGLRPTELYYMNVIDRRDDKVKILVQGTKVFQKILGANFDQDFGNGEVLVCDLNKGWDFKLVAKKINDYTNYDESAFRVKPTKVANPEGYLAKRHDLTKQKKTVPMDELRLIADTKFNLFRAEILGVPTSITVPSSPSVATSSDDDFQAAIEAE